MSVCFFSKKAFSLQIDNYFAFVIFTGSDCLRVCVNIELFNIEQRRFLHNLKWKQPKSPLQIVVLVEGEIEGRVSIASTASEYPLADFALFRSLARTVKITCWDIPDPYEKRRLPMANRKRNIQMKFYVTEEEKRLIDEKMAQLPTRRYGAYLRKMAIDGYIIQLDTTDIKRMNAALSAIGRNVNQIAKRVNAGGGAYKADMREIQERLDEIWQLQRRILSSQR